jgi:plasmid stabilization system protein ParE
VKVLYRQTASDDIVRQFRYYLVTAEAPEIALRALASDAMHIIRILHGKRDVRRILGNE